MKQISFDKHNSDKSLTEYLTYLGVPANILGFRYLRFALKLAISDRGLIDAMTKELYPAVAKEFSTSPSRVERAMRHAVELLWTRGNAEFMNKVFSYSFSPVRGKPTNSHFLAASVEYLLLHSDDHLCSSSADISPAFTDPYGLDVLLLRIRDALNAWADSIESGVAS